MMNDETRLPDNHPTRIRFTMLAVDTHQITHQLQALTARYNADCRRYAAELATVDDLSTELAHEQSRLSGNDYDEGERRQRVLVLTAQVAQLIAPEPPNEAEYRVQRSMLELNLRESAHATTSLLVWQARSEQN